MTLIEKRHKRFHKYWSKGWTDKRIATRFNYSYSAIRNWRIANGLEENLPTQRRPNELAQHPAVIAAPARFAHLARQLTKLAMKRGSAL